MQLYHNMLQFMRKPQMQDKLSYREHNKHYEQSIAIDSERRIHKQHDLNRDYLYKDDHPHGRLLDQHELKVAVDIGSGTGWFSNHLVDCRKYDLVYAVEPSQAAIDIAEELYPDNDKVKNIVGFAEEELLKIKLDEPTLFSSMCTFAHLPDDVCLSIMKSMDEIAPVGSIWAASEPWGKEYHRDCWHTRPPEWWSDSLPDWEFEFHADYALSDPPGRYKGFFAIR